MEVQCIGSYTKYRKHMLFNMVTHTMSNVIWRVYSPLWTDINLNNANNPINPKGPHLAERICRLMSCAACARPQMSAPHHQPSPALSTLACPRRSVVHWQMFAECSKTEPMLEPPSDDCTGTLSSIGPLLWLQNSPWSWDSRWDNDYLPSLKTISLLKKCNLLDVEVFHLLAVFEEEGEEDALLRQMMFDSKEQISRTIPASSDFAGATFLTEASCWWKQNYEYALGRNNLQQVTDEPGTGLGTLERDNLWYISKGRNEFRKGEDFPL